MVIDRLHFLFIQQKKHIENFGQMSELSSINMKEKERCATDISRLPMVDMHLTRLTTEDFGKELFEHLARISIDVPALRFMADLLSVLSGKVNAKWISGASNGVKSVIAHKAPEHLTNSTREVFCERYHHHPSAPDACYTSHINPAPTEIIKNLYAAVTYNVPYEVFGSEKMVIEMEKTKAALRLAQSASEKERRVAVEEASKATQEMYGPSEL